MYEKIIVGIMIIGIVCLSVGCGNQNSVETGTKGMGDGSSALNKQQGENQENIEISWETGRVQGYGSINSTWGGSIGENGEKYSGMYIRRYQNETLPHSEREQAVRNTRRQQ